MMESIITFLDAMPFWYWLVLAVALLIVELMTGSTYFLWPAIAAVAVGLFALGPFGGAWQFQLVVFALITIGLSVVAPTHVKSWMRSAQSDHLTLNQRGAQKVGRHAVVDRAFQNGAGKVRLGDTLWLAESETGETFAAGAHVEVTGSEGTKLIVKAAGQ